MQSHPPSRLHVAGALALLLLSTGAFIGRCSLDPRIPFLVQDDETPWIGYPSPPSGLMGLAQRDALPITTFRRDFGASGDERTVTLRFRALRFAEVRLNDEVVARSDDASGHWRNWKSVAIDDGIRSGANTLRVSVRNATGPPLLALRIEGLAEAVHTDTTWWVTEKDQRKSAIVVGTDRINPSTFVLPTPLEGLAARGLTLALVVLLAFAAVIGIGQLDPGRRGPTLRAVLPFALLGCWFVLFFATWIEIPIKVGFDAKHHIAYVNYLLEHGSLPRADDGWSMFHPPVYYVSTAALVGLQDALGLGRGLWPWKLVGFLAGLANALLCWRIGCVLFGARSRETMFVAVMAAVLPMNLYISAYVTNESLHAAFAAAILLSTCRLLLCDRTEKRALVVWGVLVALGVLTKYTAWIVSGVAGFFLLVRWYRVERVSTSQAALRVGGLVALVFVIAGWFYIRHTIQLGQPFPLNVDLPGETAQWWSPPGYYTPAFFWHFGSVLSHPFLAGYHTAWDSFYATLWGDGQLAGQVFAGARHSFWNYPLLAVGYALAVPATLLLLLGVARAFRLAFQDPDGGRRAAFSLLLTVSWALLGSVLFLTLRQQDYGQMKAFYALAITAPVTVFFGLGAGAADRWLESHSLDWARTLLVAWLATFAAVVLLSYLG